MEETSVKNIKPPYKLAPLHLLAILGFSCLLGWELSFVFAPGLPLFSMCKLEDAVFIRCVSVLALAATFVIFSKESDYVFNNRNRIFFYGSICCFFPMIIAIVDCFFEVKITVYFFSWTLSGIGQGVLSLYWVIFFSLVPSKQTTKNIIRGGIGGTAVFVIVNAIATPWVCAIILSTCLFVSIVIVRSLFALIPANDIPLVEEFNKVKGLTPSAFASITVCGAAYGFMSILICSEGITTTILGGASGIVGVMVALVLNACFPKIEVDISFIQRMTAPLLVLSLLMVPLFTGAPRVFFICVSLAALAHSHLFTWYSVCVDNYEFKRDPVRRYAERSVPQWTGFFIGCCVAFFIQFVTPLNAWWFNLVMAFFSVILVTCFSINNGNHIIIKTQLTTLLDDVSQQVVNLVKSGKQINEDDENPSTSNVIFENRCNNIIQEYGLTPRESDVFEYLAHGRNAAYISNKLCVSPATVKSHIYHIYQKLGVSSQQRLMDLFETENEDVD